MRKFSTWYSSLILLLNQGGQQSETNQINQITFPVDHNFIIQKHIVWYKSWNIHFSVIHKACNFKSETHYKCAFQISHFEQSTTQCHPNIWKTEMNSTICTHHNLAIISSWSHISSSHRTDQFLHCPNSQFWGTHPYLSPAECTLCNSRHLKFLPLHR